MSIGRRTVKRTKEGIMKHIVFYSGGIGSWMTAKRVVQEHGKENTILLFTDTLIEDEDLYRFIDETVKEMGAEYVRIADGRTPFEVYRDVRFLGNSRLAPCSHKLKQEVSRKWIEEKFKPEECTLYLGIDWTEQHRTKAPVKNWAPYKVEFPMCKEPYLSKDEMLKELKKLGIEIPKLYKLGFSHNNCFHGTERYITSEGLKTFKETVGKKVKVLGKGANWQDATIEHFGKQEIYEIKIQKGNRQRIIRTTKEHRWFIRKNRKNKVEVITENLQSGDRLWSMYQTVQTTIKPSPQGIAHGIVFGDGTYAKGTWNNPATVTLCGEKAELAKYFPLNDQKEVPGVGIKICDLPKQWKGYPDLSESKSYLLGWLMGYIASDGSVSKGSVSISSAKLDDLEFVQTVCTKIGIAVGEISISERVGINGELSNLLRLPLVKKTFRKEFLIREKHQKSYGDNEHDYRPSEWKVASVRPTNVIDDVYCAVVPNGHAFTLERNIYTGNCGGFCCRAGQGHFANLLEKLPERFKEYEKQEEEMRQFLNKDVAMMKKTKNGITSPYTLRQLREDYEKDSKQIDMFDIGGCGCFVQMEEEE